MAGLFGFFDYTKEGKGVYPDEPPKGPIPTFFSILGRKFWKIIQINLMYLLFSLPALIVSVLLSALMLNWLFPNMTPESLAKIIESTGITLAEGYTFEGLAASQMIIIYMILGMMLTGLSMVIAGPVHAGFTYVLRNYSREEHAFIWMDFKENFVNNLKQSLLSALFSFLMTIVLVFNFSFYLNNTTLHLGLFKTLILTIITIVMIIWCIMQMYLYPMMVTFKLSLKQLYKNCLLFSIMRLPVNLAVFVASLLLVFIIPFTLFLVGSNVSFFIALIYYVFLAFGLNLLLTNFFIYRGIDKYMIQRIKAAEDLNKEDVAESPAEQEAGHVTEEKEGPENQSTEDEKKALTEAPAGSRS